MKLTIIIVNWNTRDLLKNCVSSIIQSMNSCDVKIIVVDNNSKDGSREMISLNFPEVSVINSGDNIGFGRANNLGISFAETPLIMVLNPDTLVMEDTLERMIEFMETNPEVGALGCKIKYAPDQTSSIGSEGDVHTLGLQWFPSPFTELLRILFLTDKSIKLLKNFLPYKNPHESGYISKLYGTCIMTRREVLDQVGNFDERFFMYGEDVDLCKRIIDGGWKIYYLSEAEIIHLVAGASNGASSQFSTLMMCESISQLMQKYYGNFGKISYKLVILIGSNIRLIMLTVMRLLYSPFNRSKNEYNFNVSTNKYLAMMKWSLNLQKPIIKK